MALKAIDTRYKGHLFRSRLEARWAVFFDAMGIDWEYEKEGFDLAGTWYLPDFWLLQVQSWAEVKPEAFSEKEETLCILLQSHSGNNVIMLDGLPAFKAYDVIADASGITEKERRPRGASDDPRPRMA